MGNSLSAHSAAFLEAATAGDAQSLKQQIECEPKLLESVTLVKRRGVLHLAAKQNHPHIIRTVLDPMLETVRQEYHAHIEAEKQRQQEEEAAAQQQQEAAAAAAAEADQQSQQEQQQQQQQPPPQQQQQQSSQSSGGQQQLQPPPQQQQQTEVQLPSFKRLRQTVNARDLYRRTPLIVAAKQGHLECAHLLVDAASNLFAVDREGNTSLHYAALHGHAAVVEYLLQRAGDRGLGHRFVNKRNLSGFTALHYAAWSCRPGVVVPLLAAGADICAINDRVFDAWVPVPIGSSPLHLAVMRGTVPVAMLILQHYVLCLTSAPQERPRPTDPRTLVNLYGMNPAQLAAHRNNRQMAQLLMPSVSLSRLLSTATPPPARVFGPRSLKSIAAAVVQRTLQQQLDGLEAAEQAAATQQEQQACTSTKDSSVAVDLIVVHTDVSVGTTPASSRSASPEGGAAGLCCPSTAACSGNGKTTKAVTFSSSATDSRQQACAADCDEAADAAVSCAEAGAGGLTHALTTASSSGWYDELCCVCWESEVNAYIEPCMHGMCLGCARQLVGCSGTAGPTCPLCRGYIAGFGQVPRDARQQAGKRKKCLLAGAGI